LLWFTFCNRPTSNWVACVCLLAAAATVSLPLSVSRADSGVVGATVTEFRIVDGAKCEPVLNRDVALAGTLKLNFAGRILPHEGTDVLLFGGTNSKSRGKFDRIELPDGWLCDIEYHDDKSEVRAQNFRPNRPPAFPGAEGFGKYAIGGRGGKALAVTNLNDSGPGSFRAACEASGPRIVVFRVSGTIALKSKLNIENPYITIAGQSAPGDGICIRNHGVKIDTEHFVVRYLRVRPGDTSGIEYDGLSAEGSQGIIDHCSVSWGTDETLSINKADNFTVQWCMVAESLYDSIHKKGKHGYGGLWGGPGGSWHHNILAHHSSRNPRASGNEESGLMDFRNNVIYNWGFNSAYGGELWPRNWVNNYYKAGPATKDNVRHRIFIQADARGRMFAHGNFVAGFPTITRDNWNGGIDFSPDGEASEKTLRAYEPYVVAPVETQSAAEAFESVLAHAGASKRRDAVDARIIEETRTGTARYGATWGGGGKGIIDSQDDVGGWPVLKSEPAPADSDSDGMPDEWETSQGFDPQNGGDGNLDEDGDGYTNVEEYLNSLVTSERFENLSPLREGERR
jgi:hypothetical protein